nr:MAG TPA: hypothetical protein [Caudoviricetes sp.]
MATFYLEFSSKFHNCNNAENHPSLLYAEKMGGWFTV